MKQNKQPAQQSANDTQKKLRVHRHISKVDRYVGNARSTVLLYCIFSSEAVHRYISKNYRYVGNLPSILLRI